MKKKIAVGLVTLLSVATLAACSTGKASEGDKLVTMKGDYITLADFYDQVKTTTGAQQSMLTLILERVLEQQYGSKVTEQQTSDAYNKEVEAYGESFEQALAVNGMTPESYKQQIRVQMLLDYAMDEAATKELNDEVYQAAYQEYTPEMTAQIIRLDNQDTANGVLTEVKAEGADFAKIAGDKSVDEKFDFKFDSVNTELPAEVIAAATKLEKDAISEVIPVVNTNNYTTSYYIIKMLAKSEKNADWKTYQERLKEAYLAKKAQDANFQNQLISSLLEKSNVKIKDESFASILSQYASNGQAEAATSETTTAETSALSETSSEASSSGQ